MRLFSRIIDHRITNTATTDVIAREGGALITIVYFGRWSKAVYVLGRRLK